MPRHLIAFVLISAWLLLLLTGWLPAALTHLLLVAALVVFPWRWLSDSPPDRDS